MALSIKHTHKSNIHINLLLEILVFLLKLVIKQKSKGWNRPPTFAFLLK
jgi:hypothetical protein